MEDEVTSLHVLDGIVEGGKLFFPIDLRLLEWILLQGWVRRVGMGEFGEWVN